MLPGMTSFLLRNPDPALWKHFKARATADGHTMRWILLELIRRYVRDGLK